tara:strand:- start:663 stop:1223 length:561 start_codon:yes stop_codon:yes gene_type:complete
VERHDVEINVIRSPKSGIFGIGNVSAKVEVRVIQDPSDIGRVGSQIIEHLIQKMGVNVSVSLTTNNHKDSIVFELTGDDAGVLIGRRGETLNALRLLTNTMISREFNKRISVAIDIDGYQFRRDKSLERLAKNMAQKVIGNNKPIDLEPMSPAERRIIHASLTNNKKVTTISNGNGFDRHVVIKPV